MTHESKIERIQTILQVFRDNPLIVDRLLEANTATLAPMVNPYNEIIGKLIMALAPHKANAINNIMIDTDGYFPSFQINPGSLECRTVHFLTIHSMYATILRQYAAVPTREITFSNDGFAIVYDDLVRLYSDAKKCIDPIELRGVIMIRVWKALINMAYGMCFNKHCLYRWNDPWLQKRIANEFAEALKTEFGDGLRQANVDEFIFNYKVDPVEIIQFCVRWGFSGTLVVNCRVEECYRRSARTNKLYYTNRYTPTPIDGQTLTHNFNP